MTFDRAVKQAIGVCVFSMQPCHELCPIGEGGGKMGGKGFSHGNNSGRGAKGSILRAYALNLCDCWFIWVYFLKLKRLSICFRRITSADFLM